MGVRQDGRCAALGASMTETTAHKIKKMILWRDARNFAFSAITYVTPRQPFPTPKAVM